MYIEYPFWFTLAIDLIPFCSMLIFYLLAIRKRYYRVVIAYLVYTIWSVFGSVSWASIILVTTLSILLLLRDYGVSGNYLLKRVKVDKQA